MVIFPQAPASVVMIRPHYFFPNPETASDNSFQNYSEKIDQQAIEKLAFTQVSLLRDRLIEEGIKVHMFEDESKCTPDSVFPNNWFSTHAGGHIAIYPMYAENRRKERRTDIIECLKREYRVQDIVDYSGLEHDHIFLEGTGAMVLDHLDRVAYAVRSKRMDTLLLERFCAHFNYEPMVFDAYSHDDMPVYHTNVLMCIGTDFVMIGLDMITDKRRREEIIKRFEQSGRDIIPLSEAQINAFCGNALELKGNTGRILAISQTAFQALTTHQMEILRRSVKVVPLDVSALELSGGSVRCMLTGIHLSPR